jgi:hypothetical protein
LGLDFEWHAGNEGGVTEGMSRFTRRKFLEGFAVSGVAAATVPNELFSEPLVERPEAEEPAPDAEEIDFRYAPRLSQATICFPDDPHKTLVGQRGDLRYDFSKKPFVGIEDFGTVCTFSLAGMQDDRVVGQRLESSRVPIAHTLIERPEATLELTAFATRHGVEGRVDNVLMTIVPKEESAAAVPRIHLRTTRALKLLSGKSTIVVGDASATTPFLIAKELNPDLGYATWWEEGSGYTLYLPHGEASRGRPLRYLIRLPQEGQSVDVVQDMMQSPDALAEEVREFWREWREVGSVAWSCPGKFGEFLTSSARNIQQAREIKNGRLVFETGPTVYRNLWIVDGNFLLEAARYLGYDKDADHGLLSEWTKQEPSGQVVAASGGEHWKDTAIAMYTLVRQCELKQDWQFFKELEPNVRRAIDFLVQLRDRARAGHTTNGRYGLLAPGFADGGIGGVRSEFTNTVWTLAGLKAVAEAAERLQMDSLRTSRTFYEELRSSFLEAAKGEMVHDPRGFDYLPMLAREDPSWRDPDPWNRPRPQTAQWALSHAIFPGLVFEKDDPIVRGHIALMKACTQEDIPAETGWLWHQAVWTYNASFVAHVYLWADLPEWADRTFRGFLNHASPLYCWREEQPLQHALASQDWGDMPHNWASAECVRYLRHMLVLEDGPHMRLLEGMIPRNFNVRQPFRLERTPTRFGRVTIDLEPVGAARGWKLDFAMEPARQAETVEIPVSMAAGSFDRVAGAKYQIRGRKVRIDPKATRWAAFWQ